MTRGSLLFTSKKNPVLVAGGIQNSSFVSPLEANLLNLHVPVKKTCHICSEDFHSLYDVGSYVG